MHVFLIGAITADGFIARDSDQISTSWTSKEDKKWFSERTKQAGVVVMGSTTYNTVGRPLPSRLNIVYSSKPGPTDAPENLRFVQVPPADLITYLEKEGYQEIAICGGASIYTMFLTAGLISLIPFT
jgi:dihydrofolate reductase